MEQWSNAGTFCAYYFREIEESVIIYILVIEKFVFPCIPKYAFKLLFEFDITNHNYPRLN